MCTSSKLGSLAASEKYIAKHFKLNDLENIKAYITSLNNSDIEEINVEIPIVALHENQRFLSNVKFLDLVGFPDENHPNAVEINRKSINREAIDAICIAGRSNRGQCNMDMIKHMYSIDAFATFQDRKTIKLFILRIELVNSVKSDET